MVCSLTETDPFTQVYTALWTLVERNPYFTSILKSQNKIKFAKESDQKVNIAQADLPELSLFMGPMSQFTYNSCNRGITKSYIFALATGDLRNPIHNKISFELFRSIVDYESTLCALTWCACTFVTDCQIVSEDVGRELEDLNRQIKGWSSLVVIDVKFDFQYLKLKVV